MQEIAGNLAAGMQRIGIQCGLAWTREARARRRRENEASASASTPGEQAHSLAAGLRRVSTLTGWSYTEHGISTIGHAAMSPDEEERLKASEQILQLSEDQIVGQFTCHHANVLLHQKRRYAYI